ncbi:hypothetical protein BBX50_12985 [Ensifer sp. LC11]|nr:hypothetical protein BBX50_12985 [Ensifer sp. LC11]
MVTGILVKLNNVRPYLVRKACDLSHAVQALFRRIMVSEVRPYKVGDARSRLAYGDRPVYIQTRANPMAHALEIAEQRIIRYKNSG